MAKKVSPIVIWLSFENKMAIISHLKWDYPIKKALYFISLIIANRGSKCENNLKEVKAWDSFPIADFYLLTPS